jgi:hypothetical protein
MDSGPGLQRRSAAISAKRVTVRRERAEDAVNLQRLLSSSKIVRLRIVGLLALITQHHMAADAGAPGDENGGAVPRPRSSVVP